MWCPVGALPPSRACTCTPRCALPCMGCQRMGCQCVAPSSTYIMAHHLLYPTSWRTSSQVCSTVMIWRGAFGAFFASWAAAWEGKGWGMQGHGACAAMGHAGSWDTRVCLFSCWCPQGGGQGWGGRRGGRGGRLEQGRELWRTGSQHRARSLNKGSVKQVKAM